MNFHGEPIAVGDSVFHIRFGYLPVLAINDQVGYLTIYTPEGHELTVDPQGKSLGTKSVFWHDPYQVIPPKSGVKWQKIKAIATYTAQVI